MFHKEVGVDFDSLSWVMGCSSSLDNVCLVKTTMAPYGDNLFWEGYFFA